VAEDGVRLENQQWGDEHAPQVEALDADRVEVIRGPASVLYGSDALGGVVNIVPRELPDAIGRSPFLAGRLTASYGSGAAAREGGMLLEGAAGSVGLRGSVTGRRGDDLRTPIGDLFNSGLEAVNAAGAMGLRGTWGHGQLDIVHRSERVEIHEDPADDPLATPYQRITEDRVRADVGLPMGAARVELRFGYERNRRREFEERTATDVALGLTSTTLTGEAHLHHTALAGWDGILGVSLLRNTVDVFGDEALVPASRYVDFGAFLFEQRELGDSLWQLSGGLRFDARRLGGREPGAGVTDQVREYTAFSGR